MSDHLPECPTVTEPHGVDGCCDCSCLCPELRACEERVRQGMESLAHLYEQDAYMRGWSEALDAAREAVSGVLHWSEGDLGLICNWNKVCAAIDALQVSDSPTTLPAKAKPADLHDPQMGEMIHGDR